MSYAKMLSFYGPQEAPPALIRERRPQKGTSQIGGGDELIPRPHELAEEY